MTEFRTKDISVRVQKKLASRLSNKTVVKALVDDVTSQLLDDLYRLCKGASGDKKESEKVVKNIIKIIVKVSILYRNSQFNQEELVQLTKFQRVFHTTTMTVISFAEIDFSYDRGFLLSRIEEMQSLLLRTMQRHVTDKTKTRVEQVFTFFGDAALLDAIFKTDSQLRQLRDGIVRQLDSILENSDLSH